MASVAVDPAITQRRRALAFFTVLAAFVMDVVDSTIVHVAIPALRDDLGATAGAIQWVIAGYLLSFAVLLVTGGRLGDRFGYRPVFMTGVAAFTLASVCCGLAASAGQLVLFRVIQGAAAAIMAPQVMAMVQILYSPVERIAKLAFFGLLGGLAAVTAPVLGGLLIEMDLFGLGWRLIFLINAPIGIATIVAAARWLPPGRSPHALRLDLPGTLLLALGLTALLFPLIQGRELGWPSWTGLVGVAGAGMLALFVRHVMLRSRSGEPVIVVPSLFAERSFSLGLLITFAFSVASGGFLMVLMVYLQQGLGYAPGEAGMIHVPFSLGVMAGIALIGRRLLPVLGKWLLLIGFAAMFGGLGWLGIEIIDGHARLGSMLVALGLTGAGMGMVAGPLGPVTLARADRGHAGVAGASHKCVQQIGSAAGVALAGTVFFASSGAVHAGGRMDASMLSALAVAMGWLLVGALLTLSLPGRLFDEPCPRR